MSKIPQEITAQSVAEGLSRRRFIVSSLATAASLAMFGCNAQESDPTTTPLPYGGTTPTRPTSVQYNSTTQEIPGTIQDGGNAALEPAPLLRQRYKTN